MHKHHETQQTAAEPVVRQITPEITPIDGEEPVIQYVASDETLDRYDEVIQASGWKLDAYRRNPVFLNAHRSGDVLHVLGRADEASVQDGKLLIKVRFAVEANPVARIAYSLYKGKYLRAVSVGFKPLAWVDSDKPGQPRRTYTQQELVEVSAVPVPANPNALVVDGAKSLDLAKSDVDDFLDLLRFLTDFDPASQHAVAGQVGATAGRGDPIAPWLEIARRLRAAMRRSKN